ncbi:hypothetical protein QWY86_05645 [Pedobacter aquatilis]|uniref:hypothetical protein n=1 Tax=Pedobacter aquatilis TaxID=351343 RepID=UPI0025B30FAF|nr:hypothetical protein [Pedobacter aquatilis]MDN3586139.1 hypothetical protein [Pedobacter aquatilis]
MGERIAADLMKKGDQLSADVRQWLRHFIDLFGARGLIFLFENIFHDTGFDLRKVNKAWH